MGELAACFINVMACGRTHEFRRDQIENSGGQCGCEWSQCQYTTMVIAVNYIITCTGIVGGSIGAIDWVVLIGRVAEDIDDACHTKWNK